MSHVCQFFLHSSLKAILIIYSVILLFLFYLALHKSMWSHLFLPMLCGALIWTLIEYILHRFLFHNKITHPTFKQIQYFIHGYHHAYPNDNKRVVVPLAVTLPSATLMYFIFSYLFQAWEGYLLGFILGYLSYDTIHYTIHRCNYHTRVGKFLKYYHFHHHFKDNTRRFGVTTPLWDYIFKTNG